MYFRYEHPASGGTKSYDSPPEAPTRPRTLVPNERYRLGLEQRGGDEALKLIAEELAQSGFAQLQRVKREGVSVPLFLIVNGWMVA